MTICRQLNDMEQEYRFHVPVLANEVISVFRSVRKGIVVDGTIGCGGHARILLENLPACVNLFGLDVDSDSLVEAKKFLEPYSGRVSFFHRGYHEMDRLLKELNIDSVQGILLDLGLSSLQLASGRGFSFKDDCRLDMRFDRSLGSEDAIAVLKRLSVEELAQILREYGDVRQARKCAAMIKRHIDEHGSISATELAAISEMVRSRATGRRGRHPSTQIFQAIRIKVNRELENLNTFLEFAPGLLEEGCAIAVITYHSAEDGAVKRRFNHLAKIAGGFHLPFKKGLVPRLEEIEKNPRSRSARMRVLVRNYEETKNEN